jgi:hypothetical protein
MRFIDLTLPNDPLTKIAIEHNGQQIPWDVTFYNKSKNVNFDGMFRHINDYFKTLSPQQQDTMFETYQSIKTAIKTMVDVLGLQTVLIRLVRKLYEHIEFNKLHEYVRVCTTRSIRVPSTIKHTYAELEISERNQTENNYRSKTYLYDEYVELLTLALASRLMAPVWAEYMTTLDSTINSNHKELHALSLLSRTGLPNTAAYVRLQEYVGTITIQQKSLTSAIIEGLGTSQMPEWLLSSVLVRKLTIVELSSQLTEKADDNNVVSVVWKYVNNIIKSIDRKHTGYIREKEVPRDDGDEPDSKSIVETYKIREALSVGDITAPSVYAEDPFRIAIDIDPTIPDEYIHLSSGILDDNTAHIHFRPWQFYMMSMIMDSVLSCRAPIDINRLPILSCFAAAQALLFHWGHKELALLITAKQDVDSEGRLCGGIESRNRIPNEYVEKFKRLYKYNRVQGSSRSTDRQTNVGCRSVDAFALELVLCDWRLTCDPWFIEQADLGHHLQPDNVMIVPADVRVLLAKFLEQIA